MTGVDLSASFSAWAARTPGVEALVLFGSRARGVADELSDWDFHLIADRTEFSSDVSWTLGLGFGRPVAYAVRDAIIGENARISVVWPKADVDFVVLPARRMKLARLAVAAGLHRRSPALRRRLADMALIIRPGYQFFHGAARWDAFYRRVRDEVPDPQPLPFDLARKAELFVADYVWIRGKIARGEYLAAQRVLHRSLVETNLELLAQLRRRRGQAGWPEGRRIESWASPEELAEVSVLSRPEPRALEAALARCVETFRHLISQLDTDGWRWPEGLE